MSPDLKLKRAVAPLVVAHRGASGELPGNTMAAFERAISLGADVIEFDVRRSADGQLIVYHDAELDGRPVAGLTRSAIWYRSGTHPPLLAEVIDLARGRIGLDVEIKGTDYTGQVVAAIAADEDPTRTIVSSFEGVVVTELGSLAPDLGRGLIVGEEHHGLESFPDPAQHAFELGATHLVLHRRLAERRTLQQARRLGLALWLWTVNEEDQLQTHLRDPLVSGVVSDFPERAIRVRSDWLGY